MKKPPTPPRVFVRLSADEKKLMKRAQDLEHHRSFAEWARRALLKEAARVLKESTAA
jgi:uncharacterized protein (DUF1778 family)